VCGWQVRYLEAKLFSDGKFGGSKKALRKAKQYLRDAQKTTPKVLASKLRTQAQAGKLSGLPVGISGPVEINRLGRSPYLEFKVFVPLAAGGYMTRTVYVSTVDLYTPEKYRRALAKAQKKRDDGVTAYNLAKGAQP
jgi:hypothetical protein